MDPLPEISFRLSRIARDALIIAAHREGQTMAAFIKSRLLPHLLDDIRALELKATVGAVRAVFQEKKSPAKFPPR